MGNPRHRRWNLTLTGSHDASLGVVLAKSENLLTVTSGGMEKRYNWISLSELSWFKGRPSK